MSLGIEELRATNRGRSLIPGMLADYLAGDPKLADCYKYPPSPDSFTQAITAKSKESIDKKTLVRALRKQYGGISDPPEGIGWLADKDTFTVTTGHQLCFFTGPLYVCYKILTTINLAERLRSEHPGKNIVPVFWMASEDHDFEEINHFRFFGEKITWEAEAGNGVGRMRTDGIAPVLRDLKTRLNSDAGAASILALFEDAYTNRDNLADATRALLHGLFGQYGLVVMDGDDPELKSLFKEVMKDDILHRASGRVVEDTAGKLSKWYKLPVKPREINLFMFHKGRRLRMEPGEDGSIGLVGAKLSYPTEKVLAMSDQEPAHFSPNVILRPLYQEMLLPNLACIGGPSEVAYWLELKALFDANGVNFPVLLPRNSLVILSANETKRMTQFNLSALDLFGDPNELIRSVLTKLQGNEMSVDEEKAEISAVYEKLMKRVARLNVGLEQAVSAGLGRSLEPLDKLERKLVKAAKNKNETTVSQVNKILDAVFPDGVFQERSESLFSLLVRYGMGIIPQIKDSIDPFDFDVRILNASKNSAIG